VELIPFILLSLLTIASAGFVVFTKNAIHSVLWLIFCFFTIAGHYVLLNAQFLAVVHIIVYSGAIMVLFLFTVMLLNLTRETEPQKSVYLKVAAVVAGGLMLVSTISLFKIDSNEVKMISDIGLVENLGKVLFNQYVFPFEISSILFLSAMSGAIVLTKNDK
jgi:NADH-quinone oxidoreductase subunit J